MGVIVSYLENGKLCVQIAVEREVREEYMMRAWLLSAERAEYEIKQKEMQSDYIVDSGRYYERFLERWEALDE